MTRSDRTSRPPVAVRAARSIICGCAGIGVLGTCGIPPFQEAGVAGTEACGYSFFWVAAAVFLLFPHGGTGIRASTTVLLALQFVTTSVATENALGTAGSASELLNWWPGPFGLIASIIVIALLCRQSADRWFAQRSAR